MSAELRSLLRASLRKKRRSLSQRQQKHAAMRLYRRVVREHAFRSAHHVAFYLPIDGEIDTSRLLRFALREGKACYLPVIRPRDPRMRFVRFDPRRKLLRNKWGIQQPRLQWQQRIAPWALDLVLVPLAGFDSACTRMGMGKGYYDRTFRFRRRGRNRPLLLGLAHECQRHDFLTAQPWDVPMDAVISDQASYGHLPGRLR